MQASQLKITLFSTCLLLASASYADSWDVTQSVTLNANSTTLAQNGGSGSLQAINAINLGTSSTVKGSQTVNAAGHTLTLDQQNGSNNTQAANYINAGTVGKTGSSATQSVTADSVNLSTNAANSKQALNMINATNAGNVSQTVTVNNATFKLNTNAADNYQAGNYLKTDNITGNITQTFNVSNGSGSITFKNDQGTNNSRNIQAANVLIRKTGGSFASNATVEQTANIANVNINQRTDKISSTTNGSNKTFDVAAANYFKIQ